MKKMYTLLFFSLFLISALSSQNTRYLDPVFDEVDITPAQRYGVNATVLLLGSVGEAVPQDLFIDMYEPRGDTNKLRPLVIFWHTGNFLPHPQNGNVGGTLRDSSAVEICRRLAKLGYVAASADYRLGWNPFAATKDERVFGLINAAYRGVQDANTAVRYFKKTVAEEGNPWGVDTSRIVMFGQGTGGYISLNTAILDDYNKILTATNGKFIISDGGGGFIPMIIEGINGNVEGTTVGIVPPGVPLPFPAGDTLCYPNHPGYSSEFQVSVNLGGAMGDSSWIDPGQVPTISFHTPYDQFAPYEEGLVLVPVDPPLEVVEVQGSYIAALLQNQFGNNDVFFNANLKTDFMQSVTDVANANNDGLEGLCPLFGTAGLFDSAPWEFWDPATNANSAMGFVTNSDMTRAKAMTYIDTIMGYSLPRMYVALDLLATSSTKEVINDQEVSLLIYPNPTSDNLFLGSDKEMPMLSVNIYNIEGKLISRNADINSNYWNVPVGSYNEGHYIVQIEFEAGIVTKKIAIQRN